MNSKQAQGVAAVIELHRKHLIPFKEKYHSYDFTIFPGVFSPFIAPSGRVGLDFSSMSIFNGKRMLDIGCGSGIISCLVALSGADGVVGVDINPTAIENAKLNARQLCVSSKTDFRYGNLFEPINRQEEFDIIFADLPFTSGKPKDLLEAAFFDPDLNSIRRYIQELPGWLKNVNSSAYLCLSNIEDHDLVQIAQKEGLNWYLSKVVNLNWIELYLIELSKRGTKWMS